MDDWGYDGPCLGPIEYVHVTYQNIVSFPYGDDERMEAHIVDGCFFYDGSYYGDWEFVTEPKMEHEPPVSSKLNPDTPEYVAQRSAK